MKNNVFSKTESKNNGLKFIKCKNLTIKNENHPTTIVDIMATLCLKLILIYPTKVLEVMIEQANAITKDAKKKNNLISP